MKNYNYYNPSIKTRFLSENNFAKVQIDKWNVLFSKTKQQEEILQKDIYQMNKEECEGLLHLLKLRSVQHVNMHITNFKHYIYWCDSQGLIPHHINYFEGLGDRETVKTFISNQAMKNQIISKERLNSYTKELLKVNDYQGALILRLLYLVIVLDQDDNKCELRNIKVKDVDFTNKTIITNRRILDIDDDLVKLIHKAIKQEKMINLANVDDNASNSHILRTFNNSEFLINGRKTTKAIGMPIGYYSVTKKIREISSYLNNPHINATYLNSSGIIDYIKDNCKDWDFQNLETYEKLIDIFKLEITKEALKQKLTPLIS